MRTKLALATFFLAIAPLAQAQTQAMDPDYAAKVKEWTTKPRVPKPPRRPSPALHHSPIAQRNPRPPHRRAQRSSPTTPT